MTITAHQHDGVQCYQTEFEGATYHCQRLHGQWWVAGQDLRTPRHRTVFPPRLFTTLAEVEAACPAFAGIEDVEIATE